MRMGHLIEGRIFKKVIKITRDRILAISVTIDISYPTDYLNRYSLYYSRMIRLYNYFRYYYFFF